MNDSEANLLATVRSTCAAVTQRATLVRFNPQALRGYAETFPVAEAQRNAAADRLEPHQDGTSTPPSAEARIALSLAGVAVNFTSGWHDIMPKRPGLSGAVSTVTRLRDYEAATGPFTPERLCAFTAVDASQVFETPMDGGALEELVTLLAATLNDLGGLAQHHGGFVPLVEAADGSAADLAAALGSLPSFADVATHDGQPVAFFKRAQMAAATLHREFRGLGPGRFDDIADLTIFADNLVPHVLRHDGLLTLDPALANQIDRGMLLLHGSVGEVEIRAVGVHVAELLVQQLAELGHTISAADVDHWLWTRGGLPRFKAHRRHRCRNAYY